MTRHHRCVIKLKTYILYIICLLIHITTHIQNILYNIHVNLRLDICMYVYVDRPEVIYKNMKSTSKITVTIIIFVASVIVLEFV